ncbi:hypothetical protein [Actinacidiphila glaucinigra]|uniref:Saccharopine dehydrogenase n=1 Tax=Actinacidiphila glaucinigra TaxID=235986 RepID=A0A239MVU9_9ACTN|nr:hypothetical protein [Actinacidiphila glaucinigra]SNT45989.1 hypothetical protein SAMN05216252_12764 [Actinacidiphila glaucinigra]
MKRVLVVGGYGLVGGWVVRLLCSTWDDVEVVIGGRRPEEGETLAEECGATVAHIDTTDAETGLASLGPVDLVVAAVQDPDDDLLRAVLRAGIAHIGLVRKADNLGPTAILAADLARRPAMVMGHWQAGAATFAALATAREFGRVERVELSALFDSADPAGQMSAADSASFFTRALMRADGHWRWVAPGDSVRTVRRAGRDPFDAQPMGVLDVPAVVAATGATHVRFDIGLGESAGTTAGGAASHEIYVDMWGQDVHGRPLARRTTISDGRGQAHLTALGALIGVERVLGLDGGEQLPAGLTMPERVIDPSHAVDRLRQFGVTVTTESLPSWRSPV